MEPRDPPPPVLSGVVDDTLVVAVFFDAFDWSGTAPDADEMSAEAFLTSLGGG